MNGQDLDLYKKVVKELSSAKYQGRGYAEDGANKAGNYLAKEFAKTGVDQVTRQPFTLDINTLVDDRRTRQIPDARSDDVSGKVEKHTVFS